MEDYSYRSKSYAGGRTMQMESYYEGPRPYDFRSYSTSHAQTEIGPKGFKIKKFGRSKSDSKAWGFSDPEFQRKKRVASYKMYSVEGKVKGTFRKSMRWLKHRYTRIVYGWW